MAGRPLAQVASATRAAQGRGSSPPPWIRPRLRTTPRPRRLRRVRPRCTLRNGNLAATSSPTFQNSAQGPCQAVGAVAQRQQLRRCAPGRSSLAAAGAKLARTPVEMAGAPVVLAGDAPSAASGSRPSIWPGRRPATGKRRERKVCVADKWAPL